MLIVAGHFTVDPADQEAFVAGRVEAREAAVHQRAVVEGGDGVAKALAVGGGEIIHGLEDAVEVSTGHLKDSGLVDAGGDQERVMALAQIREADLAADFGIEVESDAARGQDLDAGGQCRPRITADDHNTTDAVVRKQPRRGRQRRLVSENRGRSRIIFRNYFS